MTIKEIAAKLEQLRPGAEWALNGTTYAHLDWRDAVQTKPTAEELGL